MSGSSLRTIVLGAVSVAALTLSAPAGAQVYPVYPTSPTAPTFGFMPAHEADAVVRSLGLTPIAPPRAHGPVIFVDAAGQEGSVVRVTVDRRSGRVRQIVRIGRSEPQIAPVPPGVFVEAEEELPPPHIQGPPGPRIVTREEIEADELPPIGAGPRVVTREPEYTGNIPRAAPRGPVDPLLGVPPEFRGRAERSEPARAPARVAARSPDDALPRIAPLPRPRPVDAPTIAQRDPVPTPPARSETRSAAPSKESGGEAPAQFPVQPLE